MKTYCPYLRAAEAILALAIFVFPSISNSQGLKIDLRDGSNSRLYSDSTRRGLSVSRDSLPFLSSAGFMREAYEIDYDSRFLSRTSYYFQDRAENRNGDYHVFELSDAALRRGEVRERYDWNTAKKSTVGKTAVSGGGNKGLLSFDIPVKFPKVLTSLVGEGGPGLTVNGNYKVMFKVDQTKTTGVANVGVNRQGTPGFQTLQEYQMFITGNVGSKLFVDMKTDKRQNVYQQRLDLEDRIQIRYKGNEEDLVQSIEAGNTTLSLGGSRYAGFSQSVQGLFGLKAQGKLGAFNWTTIASQQKGTSQSKSFKAGAEASTVRMRDKDFLRYTYFDLGRKRIAKPDTTGNPRIDSLFSVDEFEIDRDSIIETPVFFRKDTYNNPQSSTLPFGTCYVDPTDTAFARGEAKSGFFKDVQWTDYRLSRDTFYVRFNVPLTSADVVGVIMRVQKANGQIVQYGGLDTNGTGPADDSLVMKLIKTNDQNASSVAFYYEWKNVYDLRDRNIEPDGFGVNIYKGRAGEETDPNRKDFQEDPNQAGAGVKYIRLLGLDRFLINGVPGIDNKIDLNGTVVDESRGYIIFPHRFPFSNKVSFTGNAEDTLLGKVPQIYGDNTIAAGNNSSYYLEIGTKSRRTEFSLGQVNILDGSEDVRLNGTKLLRNQDYFIDYELGYIQFSNPAVADPNADVQINYEFQPFLSAQKKNLFGLRTEYASGDALKLGTTVLYRSESTIDQKPRIGEEPSRTLLFDTDFSYTSQSRFITSLVDKLPGVAASAPSAFQLDGEIARSLPNPNTLGKAFVDDFEGSKDFTNLGILREVWTRASVPARRQLSSKGRLLWFTPDGRSITDPRLPSSDKKIARFRVLEIFPDRSVPSADEKTDVLELRYYPKQDTGTVDPNSWGGIMRWMSTGLQNHQETQLLEFWVALEEGKPVPRLHFDFGKISEDINGDNILQTEDSLRLGVIGPGQDVGLPGIDATTWATDIDHINGLKQNASDPGRLSRPDTEDLDNNGQANRSNDYFSFSINPDDTVFVVPGTRRLNDVRDNEPRRLVWRLIRVPLKDTTLENRLWRREGNPSWNGIEYVRLWVDSTADSTRLVFANMELVGNRWKELGVFDDSARAVDSGKVRISVINSQENKAYRDDPPPGVSEVLNRVSNLFEREQSLVVAYENIRPGDRGLVQRVLLGSAEDYSGYRTLKMLVHGDRRVGDGADGFSDSLLFFFRFGSGTQNDPNNFYEYRLPLVPGWVGNEIQIDFDRITNLKNAIEQSRRAAGITAGVQDTLDGGYRVRGRPSLASVRWYVLGVQNLDSVQPASGEVWANELLLTDVRREAGTAGRLHFSTQLSDFGSLNADYSYIGATFRSLSAGDRSGTLSSNRASSASEDIAFSGSFQAHKLLPRFLGIRSMPISVNWRRDRSTPRLRTGSDVVLNKEFAEAERSEGMARGFSVAPSLKRETKNWLWNATFNRMSGSFSYSYNRRTDPFTALAETRAYSANMGYDLTLRKTPAFKPFGWLPSFWLLKRVEKTQFSPLPATLNFSGSVSRTQSTTILNDARKTRSGSYVRDFNGRMNSRFQLFPNLSAEYSFTTRRDLANPENLVFSANPKKFRLGLEVERNQDFKTSYNPGLFSFADTRLTFGSNYRESAGLGASTAGTRRIEAGNSYGSSITFNLSRLLGPKRSASRSSDPFQALQEQRKKQEERQRMEAAKKEEESKKQAAGPGPAGGRSDSTGQPAADRPASDSATVADIRNALRVPPGFPLGGVPADSARRPDTLSTASGPLGSAVDSASKPAEGMPPARASADTANKPVAPPADTVKKTAAQQKKVSSGGGVFLLSDALNIFRTLAARIDPIQFNYNRSNQIGRRGLRERPGLKFQFGLINELPGSGTGSDDSRSNADNYTLGSGLDLGSGLKIGSRYSKRVSRGISSSGTVRQESETFPDLTFTLSGLVNRVGLLKKILPAGSISSNYQKQKSTSFDVRTGRPNTVSTSENYSPLISVASTFSRGLSGNFSYAKSIRTDRSFVGATVSQTTENTFSFNTRYSFVAPRGIRFPFLKGIRLSSSLNTNVNVRYSRRTTRNPNAAAQRVSIDQSDLSIGPSLSYSFSTQVDGGLAVDWRENTDHIAKRSTKIRSAQFWVNLKF